MYKKYLLPLQLSIILQHCNFQFNQNKTNTNNHFLILLPLNWFFLLTTILKYEVSLNNTFLLDCSCIDLTSYTKAINLFKQKDNNILMFYSFFNLDSFLRLTFLLINNTPAYQSIDSVFENAGWPEREASEMFGCVFYNKTDTRKLLLDYSQIQHPLLKKYPCMGHLETFFDLFENQVSSITSEVIEL